MQSEDTRNLVLAVVIILAMMIGYQLLIAKHVAPQPDTRAQQNVATGADSASAPAIAGPDLGAAPAAVPEDRTAVLARGDRVTIKSPRLNGSVRLEGGRLDDLTLVGYRQTIKKDSPDVVLLAPAGTAAPYYVDFGWQNVQGGSVAVPDATTVWQAGGDVLSPGKPLTLTWDNGQGLVFSRIYTVDDNYMISVTDTVENTTGAAVSLQPYGAINRVGIPETVKSAIVHEGFLGVFHETLEHESYDDLKEDAQEGKLKDDRQAFRKASTGGWLGITDKYWLVAYVPDQKQTFNGWFDYRNAGGRDVFRSLHTGAQTVVPAGGSASTAGRLFAGAKETKLIDAYEEQYGIVMFDRAIDWGWFYFLARPVFWLLELLKGWVGNFGLAILAITVVIKLAFFQLANKSYIAMGKMRKLAPKMTAIRERLKDDPVKQREEVMKLYQTEKVNPVAGCLPILVQIPVFIALYQVLMVSIEMRHAPFYGWVHDLSGQDPLLITNLFGLIPWQPPSFLAIGLWAAIMGVTMYVQQQLNPPPPDPIQAKVFQFLPLIFIFLFASFPVGLVIYWTWNNLLTIAQQWVIMKRHGAFEEST
ncbi:membrane protein insertase YidC [Emcibacter sp. SYSU 3D8]|uniref:membrane protein insertase YidC n=1 Tax=Emcibacter sp. SYSU 3D8 TaxID=3133969 RepID=UPI0031FF00A9